MAHSMGVEVKIEGVDKVKKALGAIFGDEARTAMNREVGLHCQEKTADHIAMASVNHHKTVQLLGAKPTGHFEFAPGRVESKSKGGGSTGSHGASPDGVVVTVGNTPGIMMAFGEQTITPKRAKALTIPIHRRAYGKRAKDMEAEGYSLFVIGRKGGGDGVLMAKKGKRGKAFAAYALKKSVTLPHLPDLMPTTENYAEWTRETIEAELAVRAAAAGLT